MPEDAGSRNGGNRSVDALKPLVTDIHLRSSLAGIRGLAQAGCEVVGLASRLSAAGLWSRGLSGRVIDRRADDGAPGLHGALDRLARDRGPVVVYPGQESTIEALLTYGARPGPDVVIPYPSLDGLRAVRDKSGLVEMAADARLASPSTMAEGTAGELRARSVPEPVVLKPPAPGGPLETARPVTSTEELDGVLDGLPEDEPVLVQERVDGPLMSLALVIDEDGQALAAFQQRAERTWPADAGVSSVAVSVALDPDLLARSVELLRGAGYSGLAQLQFLQGPDGPALIDVNPRFYGSLALALACGVNLPAAWHGMVGDGPWPRPSEYRLGVSYRWLEGDVLAALRGSPRLLLLRPPRPRVGAAWSRSDPLPAVLIGAEAVATRIERRLPWKRWG